MSTIIKSTAASSAVQAVPLRLAEISLATEGRSASGTEEIIAAARRDAELIRRNAQFEGDALARAEAQHSYERQLERHAAQTASVLRQALEEIAAAKTAWLAHWEKTAVHVAAAIAARLVRRELREAPEITLSLVREALELAAGSSDLQLRLNPADYELLAPQIEPLLQAQRALGEVRIVSDPAITQGGCKLDTQYGAIDQRFESQLARIEQELTE